LDCFVFARIHLIELIAAKSPQVLEQMGGVFANVSRKARGAESESWR
jgi:hypothetical protein